MKKRVIKNSIIYAVCAAVFLFIYVYLTDYVAISSKSASAVTIIISAAVSYAGLVLSGCFIKNERLRRFLKGVGAAFVVVFAAEVLLFNFKSFTKENATYLVDLSDIQIDKADSAQINDDNIIIKGNCALEIFLENDSINALQLEFSEAVKENSSNTKINKDVMKCFLSIKDDNFAHKYIRVGQKLFNMEYGRCDFAFNTYGTLHSVKIEMDNVKNPVALTGIKFNKALPFRFYELRFYIILLIFAAVYAIKVFELYKVIYNRENIKHRYVVFEVAVLMCLAFAMLFSSSSDNTLKYDPKANMSGRDPYVQTFDAFHKGQLNLDINIPKELLELDDPYDFSARDELKVHSEWDRAFYNGKYYSYFGVAPVLLFYYPFYLISGKLPTLGLTAVVFGVLSIAFTAGAILAFIKRFIKKPNLLLVLIGIVSSGFISGTYFNVNGTSIYTIQEIFGVCFLMACIWCGIEACGLKGAKIKQPVLFALSGLSFVICVASKPTIALCALVLAPLYLEVLFCKNMKLKEKLISVSCFIAPIAVGMAGIMWYNNARFDSPFQFGAIYQLTVSNVSANSLKLSAIPYAIMHYFIQPVRLDGIFPYVRIWPMAMENTSNYVYSDASVGILTFPYILAAVCGLPFLLHHLRRKKGERLSFSDKQLRKYTYVLMLLMTFFIAWMNYCIAGVILRYVCDILPIISIMAVLVLLDIQQQTVSHSAVSGKTTCAVSLIAAATVALIFLEMVSVQDSVIHDKFPTIEYVMEDMICFWN